MKLFLNEAWAIFLFIAVWLCFSVAAQERRPVSDAVHNAGEAAPDADELLRRACAFIAGLDSFQFRERTTVELRIPGHGEKNIASIYLAARQKPNSAVYRHAEGAALSVTLVSNGENLYCYTPATDQYIHQPAPRSWEELGREIERNLEVLDLGIVPPGLLLLLPDPYKHLRSGEGVSSYLGEAELEGVKCHRLSVRSGDYACELWIEAGKTPLIRKFKPDMSETIDALRGGFDQSTEEFKFEYSVMLEDWRIDSELSPAAFVIQIMHTGQRVERFATEADLQHVLLRRPAPEFEAPLLGGGTFKLSALKNNKIVVLDFWASWCGPCVQAMPILIETTQRFKDRGVEFYAVNLQDRESDIRDFLEKHQLNCAVVLDADGAIARLYRAEAIPQTVIVDRGGTVQAVHVGLIPRLKEKLTGELNLLLAAEARAASDAQITTGGLSLDGADAN